MTTSHDDGRLDLMMRRFMAEESGAISGAPTSLEMTERITGALRVGRAKGGRPALWLAVAVATIALVGAVAVSIGGRLIAPIHLGVRNGPIVVVTSSVLAVDPDTGLRDPTWHDLGPWSGDHAWSRDGLQIVSGAGRISVSDYTTGETRDLGPCGDCGYAWSPDGSTIAVTDGTRLDLVDAVTGARVNVTDVGGEHGLASPSWSQDGRRIAFVVDPWGGAAHPVQLRSIAAGGSDERVLVAPVDGVIQGAAWSPDGTRLAYLLGRNAGGVRHGAAAFSDNIAGGGRGPGAASDAVGQLAFDLVVAAPDGSDPQRFPVGGTCYCVGWGGPDLDWAPDGGRLAIVAPYGLYTIRADGSDLRTLIGDRPGEIQVDGPPAWRPMP